MKKKKYDYNNYAEEWHEKICRGIWGSVHTVLLSHSKKSGLIKDGREITEGL